MAQNRNSLVAFLGLALFSASLFAKAGALSPQGSAPPTPQHAKVVAMIIGALVGFGIPK